MEEFKVWTERKGQGRDEDEGKLTQLSKEGR